MTRQAKRQQEQQQERERAAQHAQAVYDAQERFRGPLIDLDHLPSRTPYNPRRGPVAHWVAPPTAVNLAKRWGRDMALALLSIAPSEGRERQTTMVMAGLDALAGQIKSLGGTVDWSAPQWRAIAEFWETLIRFAEPGVTLPWLTQWREQTDKSYDDAKAVDAASDALLERRKPITITIERLPMRKPRKGRKGGRS